MINGDSYVLYDNYAYWPSVKWAYVIFNLDSCITYVIFLQKIILLVFVDNYE